MQASEAYLQSNNGQALYYYEEAIRIAEQGVSSPYHDYHSLVKERPWAEHLTNLPKQRVGALSSVSTLNLERAPMSYL